MNLIFSENLQYSERFNKYGISEDLDKMAQKGISIRNLLKEAKLDQFEEAMLINLLPYDAEEAFSLIPSLRDKLNKESLQYYLNELVKISKQN